MCANPQKENGFTAIANEIMEAIVSSGLNGTELAIILFLLRKTYGWNKKQDEISLSQFLNQIPVSKPTLCKGLKTLQLVKIVKLVKKGNSKICSNLWLFNKNYDEWQLVKKSKLVKKKKPTSKDFHTQLVKKPLHTKDNTKENTKDMTEKDFEEFYQMYPRKVGRKKALSTFLKLDAKLLDCILTAVKRDIKTEQWQNPNYIPHPTTWLNQGRWEDEEVKLNPEQYAKQLISEVGKEIAMFRFQAKYGDKELLKYYNLFQ